MKGKARPSRKAKKAAARKPAPIPKGYHPITPYLSIRGAAQAIAFYKKAFGANEIMRMPGPNGKLGHAEIEIGGARVMLSDEYEAMDFVGPETRGGTTVHIHLYAKDVDRLVKKAATCGAKLLRPVQDQFYGDRTGSIMDPFGHVWHIATHVEDVPPREMKKRAAQAAKAAEDPG